MQLSQLSPIQIQKALNQSTISSADSVYPEFPSLRSFLTGDPRLAAVLIPLLKVNSGWHILFTRRSASLPEHSGQVAFPGGRSDPHDTGPEHTALREAWEELGILPTDVQVLGRLNDFLTITNYLVTPVVGQIPWPYPLIPAAHEVSHYFTIPIDWLADPANYREIERNLPPPNTPMQVIYFNEYNGETLWGASARFTLTLIEILKRSSPQ
jgi:8-oxo-dGTP pyrophosphatase MutT (NUDIX family)